MIGHILSDLRTVSLDIKENKLIILDQTQLPEKEIYVVLSTPEEIKDAIYKLKVRGAPAIGIAAAYGIYVCCNQIETESFDFFFKEFQKIKSLLISSRPTAVNLEAALQRVEKRVSINKNRPVAELKQVMLQEANLIYQEDINACHKIGENGLSLLKPNMGLLTHCNAGHLAVSEYGTALAPIYLGEERGYSFRVFADETRPLLQGARLTAYELQKAGIDVTLICDNMASLVMKKGWIDAILVGCDRIAANGDTANKIGTSGVAVLAKYYGIPFYVLGPTSTIDMLSESGNEIMIEERNSDEITELWYTKRMAPLGVKTFNPAFDITSHELISAIITEKGIAYPPFDEAFQKWI